MNQTHRGRFTAIIEFDMPIVPPLRRELRAFIKEALESSGGNRHPDDLFFHSLGHVVVRQVHENKAK